MHPERIAAAANETRCAALRLVALNGQRTDIPNVPAADAPEAPLDVSFVGLTEEQQQAALAGFPGGRRFRLVREP